MKFNLPKTKTVAAFILLFVLPTLAMGEERVNKEGKNEAGSQIQPQGNTGPINTKSGGAPASSPQGDTPAGMQSAPKGSSETIRTDASGKPEGTPKN